MIHNACSNTYLETFKFSFIFILGAETYQKAFNTCPLLEDSLKLLHPEHSQTRTANPLKGSSNIWVSHILCDLGQIICPPETLCFFMGWKESQAPHGACADSQLCISSIWHRVRTQKIVAYITIYYYHFTILLCCITNISPKKKSNVESLAGQRLDSKEIS